MNGPRVLVLETSSPSGSVALAVGATLLHERRLGPQTRHTAALLPAVRDLCAAAGWAPRQIEAVFFSCGPGSFTGLRLAATVARMLQWSAGCAVVAVPTLETIARNVLDLPVVSGGVDGSGGDDVSARPAEAREGARTVECCAAAPFRRIAVMLDARRGQAFAALFHRDGGEVTTLQPAELCEPAVWLSAVERPFCIVGEGIASHRALCAASGARLLPESFWAPTTENVTRIGARMLAAGQVCKPEDVRPLYLRRPEAEEVYEQRRTAARARRGE